MFKSVLIANRGEIACRIIRTARQLGLRTIAVYSEADRDALHVKLADAAIAIGPAPARDSYLNAARIIAAARGAGAECIHPGYGFLSENAEFADACANAGIVFVGPPPSAIRAMGLKDKAKALMQKAGVPVVPGYLGEDQGAGALQKHADEIGYPVLIKAVAGGGGKGMRRVDASDDIVEALAGARREALGFFNNDRVLVEKYISAPRHIEMQVFGDAHGNVVHFFERDCSLQRRHQKVIEEAPAPGVSEAMRATMGQAAVAAAKAVGYVGAGTVEFIAEGGAALSGRFYFMEMNTRLQVEHPVTEMITGLDLVELQFRVAAGEKLPMRQKDILAHGHAVEARLYAEDPENDFLPMSGKLWTLRLPAGEGVRVDTGVEEGGEVTPFYDPMIAKIIAHGQTRDEALDRLSAALGATLVVGPRCNVAFLQALCDAQAFRAGRFDTGFIGRNLDALGASKQAIDNAAAALGAAVQIAEKRNRLIDDDLSRNGARLIDDAWDEHDAFQLSGLRNTVEWFVVNDEIVQAEIGWIDGEPVVSLASVRTGARWEHPFWRGDDATLIGIAADDWTFVFHNGRQTRVQLQTLDREAGAEADGVGGVIKSPMHGKVVAINVEIGDKVVKGQKLAIVEAMKMEHALVARFDGRVTQILATRGAQVAQGASIIAIEPDTGDRK